MQIINLDLSIRGVTSTLYAKQMDVGRKFVATITENGVPYTIPNEASLSVWYSGASGEGNYTKINGSSAFAISENTVTVELIAQMLNRNGAGVLCLVIDDANGGQIGTWNISYFVEPRPGCDSQEASQCISILEEAAQKAQEAVDYVDTKMSEDIEAALQEAKDSGEFDGAAGKNGADGVSVTHRWNGTTLVVTSASGTTSADLKGSDGQVGAQGPQGPRGEKGDPGKDGTPGAPGKDGAQGPKGDKGDKGDSALPPISSSQDMSYGVVGRYYSLNLSDLDLQGRELAIGDTIITADGRLWIVTRTTAESEGTCIARCVANLSGPQGPRGEKGDPGKDGASGTNLAACSYATGVLPKGRAKGDVNGDGMINSDDMDAIGAHSSGGAAITEEVARWAANVDGDEYLDSFDGSMIMKYIEGQVGQYHEYAADYYGNWQFDKANGYYYFDIAAPGMTADCGAEIIPSVTFKSSFVAAIPMEGVMRFCFKACPTEDILCRILYSPELEGVTVENGVKNSFLDSKGGTPGVGIKAITIEEVGTVLISFTIDGWGTYQAKEGMTWAEWIESEYNTIGAEADGADVIFPDDPDWNSTWYVLDEDGNSVTSDDVIAADYTYLAE